jgi:uncharacterized phage-like protein YoqJ
MEKSISFSGHRVEKLQQFTGEHFETFSETLKSIIYAKVVKYIDEGYNRFYVGMSTGIDLWVGETLVELKTTQYPNLEIVAVKPFLKHGSRFSISEKTAYKSIIDHANEVICTNATSTRGSYLIRDRYMVDHSTRLCAMVFDDNSGTGYTIKYARKQCHPVDILPLGELFNDFMKSINLGETFYGVKKYI